jgi:hypothetical protein
LAGFLPVVVVVGVWKLRSPDRMPAAEQVAPFRKPSRPSVNVPHADPTDLRSLERRLQAAGKLDDPMMRDLITDEVAEALIMFHTEPAAQPVAPPAALAAEPAKPYDLPALRAGFDEARATKDSQLRCLELGAVAEFLAANDPELAAKWIDELLVPGARDPSPDAYAFTSVFAKSYAAAAAALDDAVEWAASLSNDTLRQVAQQHIAREWALRDIGAVETWIASSDDASERSNIIRAMDDTFRLGGDAVGSAWAQRLASDPSDGPRHSDVVVRHWAKTNLDAAINWASSLSDPDDVERAVGGLVETFAAKNPGEATRWAASFRDGPVKNRALTLTAVYWAHFEPQKAAQWLQALGDPGILESTAPGVYASLMAKDPTGADSWLEGLPIRAELRSYIRSLNGQVATDRSR